MGLAQKTWREPSREVGVSHLVHSLRHDSVRILYGFTTVFHFVFDLTKEPSS